MGDSTTRFDPILPGRAARPLKPTIESIRMATFRPKDITFDGHGTPVPFEMAEAARGP